jgi:hypothetical protein
MSRKVISRGSRIGLAAGVAAVAAFVLAMLGALAARDSAAGPAAAVQYPPKKVVICHRTGSRKHPFTTISVAQSSVPAHLRHGDTLGPCSRRLNGGVTSSRITLANTSGRRVTRLGRATFTLVISDRSRTQNFHLSGKGVNRRTGVAFRGTARWRVRFVKGTYRYGSDRSARLRGSFRVR